MEYNPGSRDPLVDVDSNIMRANLQRRAITAIALLMASMLAVVTLFERQDNITKQPSDRRDSDKLVSEEFYSEIPDRNTDATTGAAEAEASELGDSRIVGNSKAFEEEMDDL